RKEGPYVRRRARIAMPARIGWGRPGALITVVALFAMPAAALFPLNGSALAPEASLVFGQSGFTAAATGTTSSSLKAPTGALVDRLSGRVFISDTGNNRV